MKVHTQFACQTPRGRGGRYRTFFTGRGGGRGDRFCRFLYRLGGGFFGLCRCRRELLFLFRNFCFAFTAEGHEDIPDIDHVTRFDQDFF